VKEKETLSDTGQKGYELRTYAFIDSMRPQYAAFLGSELEGDVPLADMAELFIELAPGSGVYSLLDSALKQTDVKPGMQTVEREFGLVEIHSYSVEDVQEAGRAILSACGLAAKDSIRPQIVSSTVVNKVTPHQAQLINKYRKGSLLVPSESLYILEVEPAAYIALAANEAEKAAEMKLIHFNPIGRFGRLFISGTESEIGMARKAAEDTIKQAQK
jgi:hypothetical protein